VVLNRNLNGQAASAPAETVAEILREFAGRGDEAARFFQAAANDPKKLELITTLATDRGLSWTDGARWADRSLREFAPFWALADDVLAFDTPTLYAGTEVFQTWFFSFTRAVRVRVE
jgi:hypothetical protein